MTLVSQSRIGIAAVSWGLVVGALLDMPGQGWANELATPRFARVLFLGNSITRHGPAPKIGWTSDWGMAASAPERDYVHLVARGLTPSGGAAPAVMVKNIAGFERKYATFDVEKNLKDAFDFRPDLVVVAIGENVPALASAEAKARFHESLRKLLRGLTSGNSPRIVVRSCFWPNKAKDEILRQACGEVGGTFVDIAALAKDEANYARSERSFPHAGVAAHPGDRGMQAIADAILASIRSQLAR